MKRITRQNKGCAHATQSSVFLDYEGDRWFERNNASVKRNRQFVEVETIKRALSSDKVSINNILEIGCSDGSKLHDLSLYFDARGHGIDPSTAAIQSGNNAYQDLDLLVATASSLPYPDNFFDLIYFGFCLYLVDRKDVFKAVSEADRVLKSGGFLAIVDFDPQKRHKRPYHHQTGLFSYKNSYADFFVGGGHYYLVAKDSFSHSSSHFATDTHERISVSVLFKEPDPY